MLILDGSHSGNEHIQSALASDQTDEITQLSERKRSHIHNSLITLDREEEGGNVIQRGNFSNQLF